MTCRTARKKWSLAPSVREADVEGRGVRVAGLRDVQQQLSAALLIDAIRGVARHALRSLLRVRRLREDLQAQRIVEEELRGELRGRRRTDLEVDVHRAPRVPARIHGREFGAAGGVGVLVAAKELLSARTLDVGVDAERVALPHVDHRTAERGTGGPADSRHDEGESEERTRSYGAGAGIRPDVGAVELLVHEEGTVDRKSVV